MVVRTAASFPVQKSIHTVFSDDAFIFCSAFSTLLIYFTGIMDACSSTSVTASTPSNAVTLTPFSVTLVW